MPRDDISQMPTNIRLQVEGMSCAGCVRRAETAISSVDGVAKAAVNLATGKADVEFGAPATPATISAAMDKAGYPAARAEISVEVAGATCASCVNRIEIAIKSLPGVSQAVMNLATGRASISYLAGMLTVDDIAAAVAGAGYNVVAEAGGQTAPVDRHKQDQDRLTRSVWIAFALGLPVFVAEMGGHLFPPIHHFIAQTIGHQTSWVLQFILTALILIFPGRVFFAKGFPALVRRAPDMNSLVALGASAAFVYSSVATFAPAVLPALARNVYFESAAVIVVLILLGRLLESRAKGRTGDAIRHLVALAPETATVERDGNLQTVPIETIRTGEILHLKPGERLAVDGVVLSGHSYVDESMITGEPVPVEKGAEAPVVAGTINGTGALSYRATAVGRDTMLSRIVRMVEDAQGAKLPIQAQVDKITAWFVP
ncbi:MAG: heavy metal translocating P-type ATPase, partial [Marinosulfonomonas sp.]|nr:heavy metal translocating P-type ATPase [Marinosulfonomonas sp.]